MTYPFQNVERFRGASPEERSVRGCTTQVYHLFPNTMVATFPTHTVLSVFEPLAIDRTMLVTYTLSDLADDDRLRKARAFVDVGLEEDRNVQAAVRLALVARNENHLARSTRARRCATVLRVMRKASGGTIREGGSADGPA